MVMDDKCSFANDDKNFSKFLFLLNFNYDAM